MARPPPKRVGALPQRTLQPASVSTLRSAFQKPDEVQVRLAGDTGLAPLISLLSHPHPKIKALARTIIDSLIKHKTGEDEEEATLNEKSGWPALAELLSYDDNDARRCALLTLGTLANSSPNAAYVDRFIGVSTLYERLSSNYAPIASATAALLGSLTQHEALHDTIMQHCELLVTAMPFSDNAARTSLCAAIGNLFLEKANNEKLVKSGAVKALTEALASNDPKVQEAAATAIAGIAAEEARALVPPAAVERLGALAHAPQPQVRRAALAAMATLASVESLHETLLRPGLIKLVTDVLLDPADTPVAAETQLHAARLLNALAANEKSQAVLNSADAWAALSKHSGSADPATAREAQQALAEAAARGYGTDKHKNQLREKEVAALKDKAEKEANDKAAKEALARELRVAKERELAKREAELKAAEAGQNAELAAAKKKLAEEEAAQRERLKKAESETLAAREAALAAREAAVAAAEKAAKEAENAAKEKERLAKEKEEAAKEAALAKERLAKEKEDAAKEKEEAAKLAQDAEAKRSAAEAEEAKRGKEVAAKEALLAAREAQLAAREKELVAMTEKPKSPPTSGKSLELTKSANGSSGSKEKERVEGESEVREAVAALDGDDKAQAGALARLAAAAKHDSNLDTLRAGGALPKVLAQIEKRTEKAPWLDLLAGIARNEANREAIRELGGLEIVMRVIKGPPPPSDKALLAALRALHALALNLRNASWLRDAGLLTLVIPLVGQEAPRLLALQILHALVVNSPATQTRFVAEKGLTTVLTLLASESAAPSDVRQAAVRVLGASAENNEKCATALKKAKGIEAIMRQTEGADEALIVAAIEALAAYGSDDRSLYGDLREARLFPALSRLLALRTLPLAQAAALAIIRKAARTLGSRVTKELQENLALIVDLVSVSNDDVARAALGALFELAREHDKLQEMLSTPDAAKAILKRMSEMNLDSQYWGLGVVWSCAKHKQKREVWRKAGAIDAASALRNSPNDNVRRGAFDLLTVLEKK